MACKIGVGCKMNSFLSGKDYVRGLFMTLSLLPMFGMASYLVISLIV